MHDDIKGWNWGNCSCRAWRALSCGYTTAGIYTRCVYYYSEMIWNCHIPYPAAEVFHLTSKACSVILAVYSIDLQDNTSNIIRRRRWQRKYNIGRRLAWNIYVPYAIVDLAAVIIICRVIVLSLCQIAMAAVSTAGTYMEGTLLKRSRGRNPSRMRVKKKWVQKRYCRLTKDTFDYFESPKKGSKPDTVNR